MLTDTVMCAVLGWKKHLVLMCNPYVGNPCSTPVQNVCIELIENRICYDILLRTPKNVSTHAPSAARNFLSSIQSKDIWSFATLTHWIVPQNWNSELHRLLTFQWNVFCIYCYITSVFIYKKRGSYFFSCF